MNYAELSKEDFDAIVTGELTHYAIWHESELEDFISQYFSNSKKKRTQFKQIFLRRDMLKTQDKIEVTKAILALMDLTPIEIAKWKSLLKRVDDFKTYRNTMAHGLDVTDDNYSGEIVIEVITRSNNIRHLKITPDSFKKILQEAESLLTDLKTAVNLAKKKK